MRRWITTLVAAGIVAALASAARAQDTGPRDPAPAPGHGARARMHRDGSIGEFIKHLPPKQREAILRKLRNSTPAERRQIIARLRAAMARARAHAKETAKHARSRARAHGRKAGETRRAPKRVKKHETAGVRLLREYLRKLDPARRKALVARLKKASPEARARFLERFEERARARARALKERREVARNAPKRRPTAARRHGPRTGRAVMVRRGSGPMGPMAMRRISRGRRNMRRRMTMGRRYGGMRGGWMRMLERLLRNSRSTRPVVIIIVMPRGWGRMGPMMGQRAYGRQGWRRAFMMRGPAGRPGHGRKPMGKRVHKKAKPHQHRHGAPELSLF